MHFFSKVKKSQKDNAAYLFNFFLLGNFFQYFEAGAVPALLINLSTDFSFTPLQQVYIISISG